MPNTIAVTTANANGFLVFVAATPSRAESSTSPATRAQTPAVIRLFASCSVRMQIPWQISRTPHTRSVPR